MNRIPKWVWLIVAAGGAYYLYKRYQSATISLTSATASTGGAPVALPGTPAALNAAGGQIASGLTALFNQV